MVLKTIKISLYFIKNLSCANMFEGKQNVLHDFNENFLISVQNLIKCGLICNL